MICPKCGNTCSEGAKFCPQCGKVLQNKCSECGERLTSNDQFCWNCGTKISQSEQDAAVSQITSTSKPKSNYFISTFLLIAIIAATAFCANDHHQCLILLISAAYYCSLTLSPIRTNKGLKQKQQPNPKITATSFMNVGQRFGFYTHRTANAVYQENLE